MAEHPEEYVRGLDTSIKVELHHGELTVTTSCFTNSPYPVHIEAGPLSTVMSLKKALELGDAIIRAAHHYRAMHAEWDRQRAANDQVQS